MHTSKPEEVFVEPPVEANLPRGTVCRLRRALNGSQCAAAAFQAYLGNLLEDVGFRRGTTAPSICNRVDDGVKMSVHVDDPLVIGPVGPLRVLFDWLGQRIAVEGLETFDSARGLQYLEMVCYTFPGGYLETIPSGYIEGMASMMGVMHAKTPTTPGIRTRHPTEADEKPVDAARQRVFRAIVGKAQWILRARPDVLRAVKELNRRQGSREVEYVAAKRLVKYLYGTRDTALELQPRKGTLHLYSASDSDWAGCPTTRRSSSGAVVWLNGALVSSLRRTQGLIALSSMLLTRSRIQWKSPRQNHARKKDRSRHATHGDQILVDSGITQGSTPEIDQGQVYGECDRCGHKTR